jgi:hypothetical protein
MQGEVVCCGSSRKTVLLTLIRPKWNGSWLESTWKGQTLHNIFNPIKE